MIMSTLNSIKPLEQYRNILALGRVFKEKFSQQELEDESPLTNFVATHYFVHF